jgi:hypothetical protein
VNSIGRERAAQARAIVGALGALMLGATSLQAQHEQHATSPAAKQTSAMNGVLGISMNRMGSGTSWVPDAVPLPGRHAMLGEWMLMVHGFVFGQYDWQQGPRGGDQWGSLNWAMGMIDRDFAGGRIGFRFMPSLDPWTVGKCGYPLLIQSGEMCNGSPIVERQHPHDFWMELAAVYERPVASNAAVLLYAAPAGEPALGPVAFMHRPSAMDEPQAPLGHHWQDATHTTYGVATVGVFTRTLRIEASAFNGHEPDDERWNFEPIQINSYSGRVTLTPTPNWSFTAGYGTLDNPEHAAPPQTVRRFVVSAMYARTSERGGTWATSVIYGSNTHESEDPSHSALIESEAVIDRHNTFFGRMEVVQKSAHDLQLTSFPQERRFGLAALSLGYIRELAREKGMTVGLGARGSINVLPSALESTYGSRSPAGGMLFLRVRPYTADEHAGMKHD